MPLIALSLQLSGCERPRCAISFAFLFSTVDKALVSYLFTIFTIQVVFHQLANFQPVLHVIWSYYLVMVVLHAYCPASVNIYCYNK